MKFFARYTNGIFPVIFESENWNSALWEALGKETKFHKLEDLGVKVGI